MRENRRVDWQWVLIFLAFFGSVGGLLYSFKFLFTAVVFGVWSLVLLPRGLRQKKWKSAHDLFLNWKERGGRPPTREEMEEAAMWFMQSDFNDYRREDLDMISTAMIPNELRPYMKSENEMPRRWKEF